ncbi:E3 binding domain-containing protein, partial [Actinomadura sp. B10D3]
ATPVSEPPAQAAAMREEGVPTVNEPGMVTPEEPPKRQPVLVGYGVKEGATRRRPRKAANGTASAAGPAAPPPPPPAPAPAPAPERPTAPRPRPGGDGLPLAKPPVRKMAKDLGVDLTTITGSGPQGSITREDVLAAQAGAQSYTQAAPAQARPVQAGPREERVPVKGVRKATAAAMSSSAFTAPHVTEFLQ